MYSTRSNSIPTIYSELNGNGSQICQNRDNRHERLGLANLGLESVII